MVFLQKNLKRTIMVHPQYLGERLKQHIKEQCSAELLGTSLDGVGYVIMVIEIQDHQIGKGLVDHLTGFTRFEVEFGAVIYRPFKNEVMDTVVASCTPVSAAAALPPAPAHASPGASPNWYPCLTHRAASLAPRHLSPMQYGFFAEAGPINIFVAQIVSHTCCLRSVSSSSSLLVALRPRQQQHPAAAVADSCTRLATHLPSHPLTLLVAHYCSNYYYCVQNMSSDYTFHEDGSWVSNESGAVMRPGVAVRVKVIGTTVYASGIGTIGTINEPFLGPLL